MVVTYHVGAGNQTCVLSNQLFNCLAPFVNSIDLSSCQKPWNHSGVSFRVQNSSLEIIALNTTKILCVATMKTVEQATAL